MTGPARKAFKVVDFSRVLAGPLCARTLAALAPKSSRSSRRGPTCPACVPVDDGMSGYYAQQNAGKRNVSIDLNVPGARELALRLCDTGGHRCREFPRRHAQAISGSTTRPWCPQPAADLRLDHWLRPGRAVGVAHGLCAHRAGRSRVHPQQPAPLR